MGLVHSATPALAEAACRFAAQAGATQKSVLARLREHYGTSIGEERLRNITRDVGEAMERFRQTCQKQRLLDLLAQAYNSRGNRKPVLAVGRDGVTLCNHNTRCYENATVGTVTIYDRQGKRLGTVYLAYPPELGQHEMTRQLTALIKAVLSAWTRPLPRLAYVTDAGYQERTYYRATLSKMTHPRTYERLRWIFVVDYYHASLRISKRAEALFGKKDKQAKIRNRWIRRMRRLLKGPRGVFRVLHSAAALYRRRKKKMSVERRGTYRTAYQYLRRHSRFMRYSQYKANQIPIGSGVTEAGCKTVFAQRLKLSGMRWKTEGARTILRLRVLLLSGVWNDAFARMLHSRLQCEARTPEQKLELQAVNAA